MDLKEAIKSRHSVRQYTEQKIEGEAKEKLLCAIDEINKVSGLRIKLFLDEPSAFDCLLAHYGKFVNANNYIALIGKKSSDLDEKCGYYGEKLVLIAQTLGLNTCWVAGSYKKSADIYGLKSGEKLSCVISIGYGKTQGTSRKSKSFDQVAKVKGTIPDWFKEGVEAALLAPTALNQQQFQITLDGEKVSIKSKFGPYSKIDLGIVKYNFEAATGRKV